MNQASRIEAAGPPAEQALADFAGHLRAWNLVMPVVQPLVLDFGLGDFRRIGLIEYWVANEVEAGYCGKFLFVFDRQTCPRHHHREKQETFFIVRGAVEMDYDGRVWRMNPGDVLPVECGKPHQFSGIGPALILEVSKPCIVADNYFADPAWDTEEGYLQFHRDLGIMPYYEYSKFQVGIPEYDKEIKVCHETAGGRVMDRIQTPAGVLTEEHVYLRESCSAGCIKHFVQSEDDLNVLQYLLEHRRMVPANLADYHRRMKQWREFDGLPSIGLPRSPLASFCCEWAGVENMSYLLPDCREKVAGLLRLMEEQESPILDAVCEVAPPLVAFPDNLDSRNLTGWYDEYMAAGHRRRIERLHKAAELGEKKGGYSATQIALA